MKGLVFSEFIEFVEDNFSPDTADEMIDASDLQSSGAYTAVGTYDHEELLTLVTQLSQISGTPVSDLVRTFGVHLFGRLAASYSAFFEGVACSFDFLELIEKHIHVEVMKLYPDAELPHFESERLAPDHLVMTYYSQRPFAPLATGLIQGCADYFREKIRISGEKISPPDGHAMRFDLVRET